jgi:hypothetical protein
MRSALLQGAAALVALTLAACGTGIDVRTVVNPDASFGQLRSFRILPPPEPRGGRSLPTDDPMLVNSITNRTLRHALTDALQARGYVANDSHPDFLVAYYASHKHKLDVTWWNYGYPWRPHWWPGWGPPRMGPVGPVVTEYIEGTVIVDLLDAQSRELLWRGRGVAVVSDDVQEYLNDLKRTVTAILDELPRAAPALVAKEGT